MTMVNEVLYKLSIKIKTGNKKANMIDWKIDSHTHVKFVVCAKQYNKRIEDRSTNRKKNAMIA